MTPPTRLLLLGAGRSAAALIQYLLRYAAAERWFLTIADAQPAHLAAGLAAHSQYVRVVPFEAQNTDQLRRLVAEADLVISMLPAGLHLAVAQACLARGCHLATASYVSPEVRALHAEAAGAGLVFLMECGLDPGLDHMSAMRAMAQIRQGGGQLTSFTSYCGGLLDPASEGDNPWRYKFTWNPRNVVLAGQSTAKYLAGGKQLVVPYQQLFTRAEEVYVPGHGHFEGYANRNSLDYRAPYGLEAIPSILRGTLRRPGYCAAWQALVRLGLTDDSVNLENSAALTWYEVVAGYLPQWPPANWSLAALTAEYLGLAHNGPEMQRLVWLGIFEKKPVGRANATPAQLLEQLLAEKWQLGPHDRDMVVMQHQFAYARAGHSYQLTSSLVVTGADATHTAMAQTVGLPLGMAVRRLARGEVGARGIVIPTTPELYGPILTELATDYGIAFKEEETRTGPFFA